MIEKLRVPAEGRDPAASAKRRLLGRRTALLSVALLSFCLEGCQAICGPCSIPSRIGSGVSNLGARIFNRRPAAYAGECCGDSGVIVEPGGPVILPGPSGVPVPASEAPATELSPIREKSPTSGTGKTSLRSSPLNGRSSADVGRPSSSPEGARGDQVARAGLANPEPTSGSASGRPSVLDDIPPVSLPPEIAKRSASAPLPIEADAIPRPVDRDPRRPTVDLTSKDAPTEAPTPQPSPAANPHAGIARMNVVAPNLAGGAAPNAEGLNWLKEKGYKTLVDLRDRNQVDSNFPTEVSKLGMLYLSMPFPASGLDAAYVTRFHQESEKTSSRPLYFMDQDGSKSALMWYAVRVGIDKVDAETAKREAKEIGPATDAQWKLAEDYLNPPKPADTPPARQPAGPELKKQEPPKSAWLNDRARTSPAVRRTSGFASSVRRTTRDSKGYRANPGASAR